MEIFIGSVSQIVKIKNSIWINVSLIRRPRAVQTVSVFQTAQIEDDIVYFLT